MDRTLGSVSVFARCDADHPMSATRKVGGLMKLYSMGDVILEDILGGMPLTENGQKAVDVDTSTAILWASEETC